MHVLYGRYLGEHLSQTSFARKVHPSFPFSGLQQAVCKGLVWNTEILQLLQKMALITVNVFVRWCCSSLPKTSQQLIQFGPGPCCTTQYCWFIISGKIHLIYSHNHCYFTALHHYPSWKQPSYREECYAGGLVVFINWKKIIYDLIKPFGLNAIFKSEILDPAYIWLALHFLINSPPSLPLPVLYHLAFSIR